MYFADSTNSIASSGGSLEYLLAFLNSELWQWRFAPLGWHTADCPTQESPRAAPRGQARPTITERKKCSINLRVPSGGAQAVRT